LQEIKAARDQINRGDIPGSRVFIAGNIIGVNGPLSRDFYGLPVDGFSEETISRINSRWEQGVGHETLFMTPEELRVRIREYMDKGIDFIKVAVSGHGAATNGLLNFSPQALQVIIEEARARGMTVQTHTMTVEALRIFAAGDFDLAQHCSTTLREAVPQDGVLKLIPDSTIQLIVKRKLSCSLNAYTDMEIRRRIDDTERKIDIDNPRFTLTGPNSASRADTLIAHQNELKLIRAGVQMLMVTDAGVPWIDSPLIRRTSPCWRNKGQCLHFLGEGHIAWLRAVHEKGMAPMEMLKAATRNVAAAYKKLDDLGTLERGKLADVVVLDADPLADPDNYGRIHLVMKDGRVVDRDALPVNNVLTKLNAPRLATR
jgi:imidazolonepropionase-like amidohydrolase